MRLATVYGASHGGCALRRALMCGISGFLDASRRQVATAETARRMASVLEHRGPDDAGEWIDAHAGAGLGFRRLAIIDLTEHGHQPMVSASGRHVIVFNGEIYNHAELRKELAASGTRFRGDSDTEALLEAVDRWGLQRTLRRTNGMFAFAIWDRDRRHLHLARDRIGEKPLYYGVFNSAFVFGSTLDALRQHPAFEAEIDRDALSLFLRHNYIPAPHSIYRRVRKLPPGCSLTVSLDRLDAPPEPYWSVADAVHQGQREPLDGNLTEAADAVEQLLGDSVSLRMVADVPLGAFLSGGIDSSTVVAMMQARATSRVRTFTIGFGEAGYDEAQHAAAVARHLGTDHTELYVTPADALAVVPRMAAIYDEPFADSSQIPTYLVSELARRDVTVALSGDGGDELFAGYDRYRVYEQLWGRLGRVPVSARRAAARALTTASPDTWDALGKRLGSFAPRSVRQGRVGERAHKLAALIALPDPEAAYSQLVSHWTDPSSVVIGGVEPLTPLTDRRRWLHLDDLTARARYLDMLTYLPDDILVKVDRASMAVSLEARVPMLDHRLVELAWRLPRPVLTTGGGKRVLREVLYRYVPPALVDRPKMGFGVPIGAWLRGPLRDWAEDLLEPRRLAAEGLLRPEPVTALWREHLSGRRDWKYLLWDVLMLQSWLREKHPNGL